MYVITGATGNVGRQIIERLAGERHVVRAVGRSKERMRFVMAKGAQPFVCDLTDTDELSRAFDLALGVFAMIPPAMDRENVNAYQKQIGDSIATAIENAGVKHVVCLSSIAADKSEGTGPVVGLHDFEERLNRIDDLNVLHLRCGYFMENTFSQIGIIRSSGSCAGTLRPDLKIPMIATQDIAEIAAKELLNSNFTGKQTRELLGQREVSMNEVAAILGNVCGQTGLKYVQIPEDQARTIMIQFGMSVDMTDKLLQMVNAMNTGHMRALESRSAQNTTGTSYEAFAKQEFLPRFRQSEPQVA
jgi:uncharacterized protein YbjT (DUF2867 family)